MSVALTKVGDATAGSARTVAGCLMSVMSRMTAFVVSLPTEARTRLRFDGADGANTGAARSVGAQPELVAEGLAGGGLEGCGLGDGVLEDGVGWADATGEPA